MSEPDAPAGTVQLAGMFLEKAGALDFVLLLGCAAFAGVACYLYLRLEKQNKGTDARVESRVKEYKANCEKELAELRDSHAKELLMKAEMHARDLKSMVDKFAELVVALPDTLGRMNSLLEGFRQDLRRIYDKISESSEKAGDKNLETVKALTQVAGTLVTFPAAIKLMFREILSEDRHGTSFRQTEARDINDGGPALGRRKQAPGGSDQA